MTPPTPAPQRCVCGEDVITTPRGKKLDATPDILGIHRPDGTWQTVHDKAAHIPGHHTHRCPGPQHKQGELFA